MTDPNKAPISSTHEASVDVDKLVELATFPPTNRNHGPLKSITYGVRITDFDIYYTNIQRDSPSSSNANKASSFLVYPIYDLPNYHQTPLSHLIEALIPSWSWDKLVPRGSIAIDIGAHTGDTALMMASLVGSEGAVIAFEPNPMVFDCLYTTSIFNHSAASIYTVKAAVGASYSIQTYDDHGNANINGGLRLQDSDLKDESMVAFFNNIPNKTSYLVDCVPLLPFMDNLLHENTHLCGKPISFVKIDVEGFEANIISASKDFFLVHRPFIFAEVFKHYGENGLSNLWQSFLEIGYIVCDPHTMSHISFDRLKEFDDVLAIHQSSI